MLDSYSLNAIHIIQINQVLQLDEIENAKQRVNCQKRNIDYRLNQIMIYEHKFIV